jgi:hypothetical protein
MGVKVMVSSESVSQPYPPEELWMLIHQRAAFVAQPRRLFENVRRGKDLEVAISQLLISSVACSSMVCDG